MPTSLLRFLFFDCTLWATLLSEYMPTSLHIIIMSDRRDRHYYYATHSNWKYRCQNSGRNIHGAVQVEWHRHVFPFCPSAPSCCLRNRVSYRLGYWPNSELCHIDAVGGSLSAAVPNRMKMRVDVAPKSEQMIIENEIFWRKTPTFSLYSTLQSDYSYHKSVSRRRETIWDFTCL